MKNSISEKKLFMMLSTELFAMTSLILPAILVGFAGNNGLPVLLAASAVLILLAVWYLSCYKNKEKSLDQLVNEKKGMKKGILKIIYMIRYFLHGLFLMIIFVNLIQEVLLPEYSFFWILVPFLLLVYLMTGKQLRVRGRILEVLFPYIFIPLLLVLFLALFQLDYKSLPAQLWGGTGNGTEHSMLYSVYGIVLFYQPVEFILFLLPALRTDKCEKEKRSRAVGAACIFVIIINVIMYVSTIGMFGPVRTGEKLWSALYIMQSVRLPGKFVERLDILFLVFWIFSTFALFSAYMYYGSRFIVMETDIQEGTNSFRETKDMTDDGRKSRRYTVIWLLGILIVTLLIQKPKFMFEFFVPYKMWVDLPLAIVLPGILYADRGKNKKTKAVSMAVLFVLCGCMLTGCQDRADIEDRNYIMTIGVEKGREKQFRIIYEIADLSKTSQDGGGRKGSLLYYEADSLKEAEEIDRQRTDKKLDYGHLKAIIFSKDFMEESTERKEILAELKEFHSIAGTTLLFFTEEELQELMEAGEKKASSFGEYMDQMMVNQKYSLAKEDTLSRLLRDVSEKEDTHRIWLIKKAGDQLELEEERIRMEEETDQETIGKDTEEKSTVSKLADAVLRLHIRANSNSLKDQKRKNAIRDRILPKLRTLLAEADSKSDSVAIIENSTNLIKNWVVEACALEDYDCEVNTYLCRERFPLKVYGNMIFPSGIYDALRIDLGKAEGANWWCMMYPSLCFTDSVIEKVSEEGQEELKEELGEEEYETLFLNQQEKKFKIKWKITEWFQGLWSK